MIVSRISHLRVTTLENRRLQAKAGDIGLVFI